MYKLRFSVSFVRDYNKLVKKNKRVEKKIRITFKRLAKNPFDKRLNSHKVNTPDFGIAWSSKIDRDLRVIWDFATKALVIYVLDIGGHSGKRKVYK